uniref:Putative secreted protein n=1 Tax=Ixodes ricinus TaxID=34613 RepID=A0A6B0UEH7_IXORI
MHASRLGKLLFIIVCLGPHFFKLLGQFSFFFFFCKILVFILLFMCFEGRNGVWQYSWRGCESNGQEDERVAIVGNQAFMMHSVPFVMGLLFYILSCNAD